MQATLRALRATHDVVTKDLAASQARAARLTAGGVGGGAGAGTGLGGAGAGPGLGGSAGAAIPFGASTASLPGASSGGGGGGGGGGGLVSSTTVGGGGGATVEGLRVERSQLQQALVTAADAARAKAREHQRELACLRVSHTGLEL